MSPNGCGHRARWVRGRCVSALLGMTMLMGALMVSDPAVRAADTALIVPGQSLGPARLGMTGRELQAVLGPGAPGLPGMLVFSRWGVVATVQDGVVVRLSTTSPHFRTVHGVGYKFVL